MFIKDTHLSVIEDLKSLIPDIDTQVGGATTIRQFSDTLKGFIKNSTNKSN